MLRIAVQSKGRLYEETMDLLKAAGIKLVAVKRTLLVPSRNFPVELLFLRDDDIPDSVASGTADIGIVGLNEVAERDLPLREVMRLGFGACRISLAVPRGVEYHGPAWFNGRCVATSYPHILRSYFDSLAIKADIHEIAGSVEIAPAVGMADGIFDIVSSGGTLIQNGLVEVEQVFHSEAALVANPHLSAEKLAEVEKLKFRFSSIVNSRGFKYVLMNVPSDVVERAVALIGGMRSPTVLPLAAPGWCSLHTVMSEDVLWQKIEALKELGAEGILVLNLENMIP